MIMQARISLSHRTDLVIVIFYFILSSNLNSRITSCFKTTIKLKIDKILIPYILSVRNIIGPGFLLIHGNARPHTTRHTRHFLESHDIQLLTAPHPHPSILIQCVRYVNNKSSIKKHIKKYLTILRILKNALR